MPAADHPGQAARRLHPRGPGAAPRLHRRLGAPQAQRPGAAHRAVQGPVPVRRRPRGVDRLIEGMSALRRRDVRRAVRVTLQGRPARRPALHSMPVRDFPRCAVIVALLLSAARSAPRPRSARRARRLTTAALAAHRRSPPTVALSACGRGAPRQHRRRAVSAVTVARRRPTKDADRAGAPAPLKVTKTESSRSSPTATAPRWPRTTSCSVADYSASTAPTARSLDSSRRETRRRRPGPRRSGAHPRLGPGSLVGKKVGSRVAHRRRPRPRVRRAGQRRGSASRATDTLVFVVDIISAIDGPTHGRPARPWHRRPGLPTVTETRRASPPRSPSPRRRARRSWSSQPLIEGTGAEVKARARPCSSHYTGALWKDGKRVRLHASRPSSRTSSSRSARAGHQGLGQGPGRQEGRQPGAARHPAGRRLRHGRQPAEDQGQRHPGLRRRHPRRH